MNRSNGSRPHWRSDALRHFAGVARETNLFAALTKEAGIPDGIFSVVTGFGPEIGSELIAHPGVASITFTGSDATGAKVYERAARSLKRVSLELGEKSQISSSKNACKRSLAEGIGAIN
nr:aldehyde dehydrogenase family protein [Bradyrhizobium elkanii]